MALGSAVPLTLIVPTLRSWFSVGAVITGAAGATVSTVQVREAGEASTLPAASMARTWKVCAPWARPV